MLFPDEKIKIKQQTGDCWLCVCVYLCLATDPRLTERFKRKFVEHGNGQVSIRLANVPGYFGGSKRIIMDDHVLVGHNLEVKDQLEFTFEEAHITRILTSRRAAETNANALKLLERMVAHFFIDSPCKDDDARSDISFFAHERKPPRTSLSFAKDNNCHFFTQLFGFYTEPLGVDDLAFIKTLWPKAPIYIGMEWEGGRHALALNVCQSNSVELINPHDTESQAIKMSNEAVKQKRPTCYLLFSGSTEKELFNIVRNCISQNVITLDEGKAFWNDLGHYRQVRKLFMEFMKDKSILENPDLTYAWLKQQITSKQFYKQSSVSEISAKREQWKSGQNFFKETRRRQADDLFKLGLADCILSDCTRTLDEPIPEVIYESVPPELVALRHCYLWLVKHKQIQAMDMSLSAGRRSNITTLHNYIKDFLTALKSNQEEINQCPVLLRLIDHALLLPASLGISLLSCQQIFQQLIVICKQADWSACLTQSYLSKLNETNAELSKEPQGRSHQNLIKLFKSCAHSPESFELV